ncbi:UbiA prenyltransferase family-domain-containing protein [Russula compacta]|nr:UbiA prenyltransferase family-domain-containing protein [Russula compacta]
MRSPTPHCANNSPSSVSINLSFSAEDYPFKFFSTVNYHLYTAILFTWTDHKTIFLPITAFACATAPLRSFSSLLQCWIWIWFHLFLCNVSNQARSCEEDKVNRPWRPLPAGRITESQAVTLRWTIAVLCLFWSSIYGQELVLMTIGLVITTVVYDELGTAGHIIGKNFCAVGGYASFEVGATIIIGTNHAMDFVSVTAVIISGIMIFTTIQAQDFADVEGDKALGRMTFPIYAPEFSRAFTLIATVAWSVFLSWFWGVGPVSAAFLVILGTYVGMRYYLWRTLEADKKSYTIFNIWLMAAHTLPLHTRTSVLAF